MALPKKFNQSIYNVMMKALNLTYYNMRREQPKFLGSYHIILLDGEKTNARWDVKNFIRTVNGEVVAIENEKVACWTPLF